MIELKELLKNEYTLNFYTRRAERAGKTIEEYYEDEQKEIRKKEELQKRAEETIITCVCKECGKEEKMIGRDFIKKQCCKSEEILKFAESGTFVLCSDCQRVMETKKAIKEIFPPKFRNIETDKKDLLAANWNANLFISGKSGTGKSVFACSVGKKRLFNGQPVVYVNYTALIMQLQAAFSINAAAATEKAGGIARYRGLLILDDLGAQKLTDYVRQVTYYILNEREQYQLDTVITSNFSLKEIDRQIDARVSSRIAGMCKILEFGGKDRRIPNP